MLTYSDVENWLSNSIEQAEIFPSGVALPTFSPGPYNASQLSSVSPQDIVFISVGGGAGLTTELLFDRPFISIRVVGRQNDFRSAEKLAHLVDLLFLGVDSNQKIGTTPVLSITRTGGGPQMLELDSADRYHYSCSYIAESQTGM